MSILQQIKAAFTGKKEEAQPSFDGYTMEAQRSFEQMQRQRELTAQLIARERQLAAHPELQTQYISVSPRIQNKREMNIAKRQAKLQVIKAKQSDWQIKESLRRIRKQLQIERIKSTPSI